MVDIRPPVFPIGPLPRVAFKSPLLRAVLNLLLRAPTTVRVCMKCWCSLVAKISELHFRIHHWPTKIPDPKFSPSIGAYHDQTTQ